MTAWIALVISTITLIINIIVQRDKLLSFLQELKTHRVEKNKREKDLASIDRFIAESYQDSPPRVLLPSFFIPIFLLSVISSAILRLILPEPTLNDTLTWSWLVYFTVSGLMGLGFIIANARFEFRVIGTVLFVLFAISITWGFLVALIELISSLRMMWSGIIIGGLLAFRWWLSDRNHTRQLKKHYTSMQGNKEK